MDGNLSCDFVFSLHLIFPGRLILQVCKSALLGVFFAATILVSFQERKFHLLERQRNEEKSATWFKSNKDKLKRCFLLSSFDAHLK